MSDSAEHLFSDVPMQTMKPAIERKKVSIDAGPIVGLAGTEEAVPLWKGKISSAGVSEKRMRELVKKIDRYYVPADPEAPTQCIDGRPGTEKDRPHGAKIPGGTAGVAFAVAILGAKSLREGKTFVKDFARLLRRYKKEGYPIGGHVDDHAHTGIGCGAIDRMPDVLDTMQEPAFAGAVEGYLSSVLEADEYIPGLVGALIKNAKKVQRRKDSYFGDGYGKGTRDALKTVGGENAVETLTGGHQEALLVINLVPGTTLNRDAFSSSNTDGAQAFNYDFWAVRQEAERLYPLRKNPKGLYPDGADVETRNKRLQFVIVSLMIAVATMMQLSDGSTRLIVRPAA